MFLVLQSEQHTVNPLPSLCLLFLEPCRALFCQSAELWDRSLNFPALWFLCRVGCKIPHGKPVLSVAVSSLWGLKGSCFAAEGAGLRAGVCLSSWLCC